jgi:hypothetical protein
MSTTPRKRRATASTGGAKAADGAADVLCYLDQGSFVGLRALGRQPVIHFTWIFEQPLDRTPAERLNEGLAEGLLGRLLQRSPLPFGRHRWVRNTTPAPITWFDDPIPFGRVHAWRDSLLSLPVDPEHGPGWRMAAQVLEGGGAALSLLISHTIADSEAAVQAIADAAASRRFGHEFPAPSSRWSPARFARDGLESLKAMPDAGRAVAALLRQMRQGSSIAAGSSAPPPRGNTQAPDRDATVPLLQVLIDAPAFASRSADLGLMINVTIAAFAARLAFRMGRVDSAGRVKLVLPVSDRQPGDRRGNALRSMTVMADPEDSLSEPARLQRAYKSALVSLLREGNDLSALLPLVPYIPLWLARHMERAALGSDLPVGCSFLGELPPELSRPCGKASLLFMSPLERFTASALQALGGQLFVGGYRFNGYVMLSVAGYVPGSVTGRNDLMPLVQGALADIGLDGRVI